MTPAKIFTVIDIETTGLDSQNERITEVALVKTDGRRILSQESFLLNPERRIPEMIVNLTGITNELVADQPRFASFAKKIVTETEGSTLIGHNVRFDYGFLCAEFRRLGFSFRRSTSCTVRLARKLVPGLSSYSLGKLCHQLGLLDPADDQKRHRALFDALLTAKLFIYLFQKSQKKCPEAFIKEHALPIKVPLLLQREDIENLPGETGVYYFYDSDGRLLYVGKSKNIRDRVISHFNADLRSERERIMKDRVARIDYQITGSELVALLLESDEIKRLQPIFNRAQRRAAVSVGLFVERQEGGYSRLYFDRLSGALNEGRELLRSFKNSRAAKAYLESIIESYELCPHFCDRPRTQGLFERGCFHYQTDRCKGACLGIESAEEYNLRVEAFLEEEIHARRFSDCVIVDQGRFNDEQALVLIENGSYKGFGFAKGPLKRRDLRQAMKDIEFKSENSDVRRILRQSLQKPERSLKIYPLVDL